MQIIFREILILLHTVYLKKPCIQDHKIAFIVTGLNILRSAQDLAFSFAPTDIDYKQKSLYESDSPRPCSGVSYRKKQALKCLQLVKELLYIVAQPLMFYPSKC